MEDFGKKIEGILNNIISEPLLADFIHLRPSSDEKNINEVCDLLIENEPLAIPIQLKVQDLDKAKQNREEKRWVEKQIKTASSQTKGAINTIRNCEIYINNPIRGNIKYEKGKLVPNHGIVILDYKGKPILIDSKIDNRYYNIPIHYFSYNDFVILCQQLKTLPDLICYLDERSKIPLWSRPRFNDEKNVYAYYLMNTAKFNYNCKLSDFDKQWEKLTVNFKEKYSKKIKEDEEAILYKKILEELFRKDPIKIENSPKYIEPILDKKNYKRVYVTRLLNNVRLLQRREISKKYLEKIEKADNSPMGFNYFAWLTEDQKTALFFLASRHERPERMEQLSTFSTCVYDLMQNIDRVIGIATENLHSKVGRSFDYILIENIKRDLDKKHLKQCKFFFKDLEFDRIFDFPDDKNKLTI